MCLMVIIDKSQTTQSMVIRSNCYEKSFASARAHCNYTFCFKGRKQCAGLYS